MTADHINDHTTDVSPAWSPDGRHIAFVRDEYDQWGGPVYLISPIGGGELKLNDFIASEEVLSWSPDSRFLVTARSRSTPGNDPPGIYLMPVSGGDPRRILAPPVGIDYSSPVFSPDGRLLAFVARDGFACDIYIMEITADSLPVGHPRRITRTSEIMIDRVVFAQDGRELVYGAHPTPFMGGVWRIAIDGTRAPERIEIAGIDAWGPHVSPAQHRLLFCRSRDHVEVYRFEPGHEPKPVLTSSVGDYDQDYSPDGSHIAFASVRSGEAVEIWLAKVDGSDPHQLAHGPGRIQGSPRWSPDGRRIAFDSFDDSGHWHVWTIDADGGVPRRLTNDPGHQNRPTWSGDGTYVYYAETTGNQQDIWRIPSTGGVTQQVTRTGSVQAYE